MELKTTPLRKLIMQGEGPGLDFKFEIADARKIARTFVAFANTKGGSLLIGVDDQGGVVGIQSEEEVFMARNAAREFCRPEILFSTREWKENRKTVLQVKIPEGIEKPYYALDNDNKWKAFVRIGDENVVAESVFVKTWKKKNSSEDILISFSDTEKLLMDFLHSHSSITLMGFSELAQLGKREAEEIISKMAAMDILHMDYSRRIPEFSLNPEIKEIR